MARPRKEIDWEQFDKLCHFQCTLEEIAGWFKCSVDTIERAVKREKKQSFAEYYKRASSGGKISLRRNQFKLSETNASMAIWLGKQYLGQAEDKGEPEERAQDKLIDFYTKLNNAIHTKAD